jgi:ADP-heptose:LPS heptosyltransferase
MKILAIQFRYLGDAVLLTPALRALREHFPQAELHVLVAQEVVPLLEHLPWLTKVWAFPRKRGQAKLREAWPVLRGLRRERFDRLVDFSANDRSALISLACGARERLAPRNPGGFLGRRLCYTKRVVLRPGGHQSLRNLQLLSAWGVAAPSAPALEICADPALAQTAEQLLPTPSIIGHISTSQPRKEWPLKRWAQFNQLAAAAGYNVVFSAGTSPREQELLNRLKGLTPGLSALPVLPELATYLAVLKRARLVVCGCTGPLHFAAALGVPTIGLYGPSPPSVWAPLGPGHQVLRGNECSCGDIAVCVNPNPCMGGISAKEVIRSVKQALPEG